MKMTAASEVPRKETGDAGNKKSPYALKHREISTYTLSLQICTSARAIASASSVVLYLPRDMRIVPKA